MNIAELLWCNETLEAYGVQACSDYPATDFYQVLAHQRSDRCDESDNDVDASECGDGLQPAHNYRRQLLDAG